MCPQSVCDALYGLRGKDSKFFHRSRSGAYARTYYPDTEEAKQALAILTDLYANEADETMRQIAVDTS